MNFVNNFSEIAGELVVEMEEATNLDDRNLTSITLRENLGKIVHHGKRAETIVRQLQKHINTSTAHEYFEEDGK